MIEGDAIDGIEFGKHEEDCQQFTLNKHDCSIKR